MDIEKRKEYYRDSFINPRQGVKELLEWMEKERQSLHDKAEREPDVHKAYGYIKEARGVQSVLEQINSMIRETKVTNRKG